MLLYSASHAIVNHYSQRLSEVGLSYEQSLVMVQHQQLALEELADKLNLELVSLSTIIRSLENVSLFTRAPSNQNDCSVILSLTAKGTEVQHKTSQIQQKMSCETVLTQLEHVELREKLDKLLDNFKTRVQRPDIWLASLDADL